jgi:hypothetical protein
LEQNVAVGRAQGFAQANLAGTLGDRNQHDVDDPDRPQGQGYQTHAAEEPIHRGEYLAHGFLILHRVPFLPNVFRLGIETPVVASNDAMELVLGGFIFLEGSGLIIDERDCVAFFRVVSF